ncbi:hypothetical protein IMAU10418_03045 [Lactiplantibacillus plantarum]|nr:hypothetical protein [Lactiplantibacillus plantarum]
MNNLLKSLCSKKEIVYANSYSCCKSTYTHHVRCLNDLASNGTAVKQLLRLDQP